MFNEEINSAAIDEIAEPAEKDSDTGRAAAECAPVKRGRKKNRGKKFLAVMLTVVLGCGALGFGIGAGSSAINRFYNAGQQTAAVTTGYITRLAQTGSGNNAGIPTMSGIVSSVNNSVVSINTTVRQAGYFNRMQTGQAAGSGIVFKEDSNYIYIVTNYHVINQASQCTISFDDKTQVAASFVGGDQNADIAVIKVSKSDLSSAGVTGYKLATFGKSADVMVGDPVVAIGNAFGEGKSATFGIVSAMGRTITDEGGQTINVIQTDAAINPGNSGGALVTSDGKVIGITSAKLVSNGVENMGYAIPSDDAVILINQIMSPSAAAMSSSSKPLLGVSTIDITQAMASTYNMPVGVYVNDITPGSAADKMGIQQGDVITGFNGADLSTTTQLAAEIAKTKVGDKVTVTVIRISQSRYGSFNGASQTLTLNGVMQPASAGTDF